MSNSKELLGLIAADGTLPLSFIEGAYNKNKSVFAVALTKKIADQIKKQGLADNIIQIELGKIDTIIKTLVNQKISKVVLLGKINKSVVFRGLKFDKRAQEIIKKRADYKDSPFMQLAINELEKDGLTVINQNEYLTHLLAVKSVLTSRKPTESELDDIRYGLNIASKMADMEIGQCIVVRNKTVIAVEALEGTDATILRAGKLVDKDAVVIKVSRTKQDMRFDIPTIGLNTLKSMQKSKLSIIAIEAQKTFLVDKEDLINYANKNNICIVAENIQ